MLAVAPRSGFPAASVQGRQPHEAMVVVQEERFLVFRVLFFDDDDEEEERH